MTAKRLDIVFDRDIAVEDDIDEVNKKIFGLFGFDAKIDWRDERTVEITIFSRDVGISAPRPWMLED